MTKLLVDVGRACLVFHDKTVRDLMVDRVQCDEIWSFVYAKEKNVPDGMEGKAGDVWTWTAIDADTKLIVSWFIGGRDALTAQEFMADVADRINTVFNSPPMGTVHISAPSKSRSATTSTTRSS
ncbi:MAG: hypothetical protein IPH53_22285 [Flavobacteriales bacterium]|nr:hypothetical protein [Flavobacteriales bacterium]